MFPGFPKKSRAQSPRDHLLRLHLKISPYHAHPLGLRPALRAVLLRSEPFTLDLRAHILSYLLSMPRTQPPETEPNTPVMQAGRGQTGCLSRVAQQGRSGTADTGAPAADSPCSLDPLQGSWGPPSPGRLQTHSKAAGAWATNLCGLDPHSNLKTGHTQERSRGCAWRLTQPPSKVG